MGKPSTDLKNQKFGMLTVLEANGKNSKGELLWLCRCDCGNITTVTTDRLRSGKTKSCGCYHKNRFSLIGQRFGMLYVLERHSKKGKVVFYTCKCDCGNLKTVRAGDLRSGRTTSCGCYGQKMLEENRKFEHGLSNTRLYSIWDGMKKRCYSPKHESYKYYGGRGITICDEWRNNFKLFYDWALDNGYKEYLTIDRIDVNGNYEPSNCRWVTMKEQAKNKRTT